MKYQRRLLLAAWLCALITAGSVSWWGCSVSGRLGINAFGRGNGAVRMYLTDASASYDSVVVFITRVEVIGADKDESTGWALVRGDEVRCDLMSLRDGTRIELGSHPLADGHYTQIRLCVSPGSYVVDNGVKHSLFIPHGMEKGIKLIHGFDIVDGELYEIVMDFDAAASIHINDNGNYVMNPVIRVLPAAGN